MPLPSEGWEPPDQVGHGKRAGGGAYPVVRRDREHVADAAGVQVRAQPRVGPVDLVPGDPQRAGIRASNARASIALASAGLVANPTSSGTPAAASRAGSSAHDLGRYSARSRKACPPPAAYTRYTPTCPGQLGEQPKHERPGPPPRLRPGELRREPAHQLVEGVLPAVRVHTVARGHRKISSVHTTGDDQPVAVSRPGPTRRKISIYGWSIWTSPMARGDGSHYRVSEAGIKRRSQCGDTDLPGAGR